MCDFIEMGGDAQMSRSSDVPFREPFGDEVCLNPKDLPLGFGHWDVSGLKSTVILRPLVFLWGLLVQK